MAPAINSARPPKMTTLVDPKADKPAVKAKGTVRPSERPMVASEMTLAFTLNLAELASLAFSEVILVVWDSRSESTMTVPGKDNRRAPILWMLGGSGSSDLVGELLRGKKMLFRNTNDMTRLW
jgi:hypothetical protein